MKLSPKSNRKVSAVTGTLKFEYLLHLVFSKTTRVTLKYIKAIYNISIIIFDVVEQISVKV